MNRKGIDHLLLCLRVGASGGVICLSSLPFRMDSISCSRGDGSQIRGGPNWRSLAWWIREVQIQKRIVN